MWSLIFNGFVRFVEAHPEVIDQLVNEAVTAGLNALKAHNASAKVS